MGSLLQFPHKHNNRLSIMHRLHDVHFIADRLYRYTELLKMRNFSFQGLTSDACLILLIIVQR